MNDGFNKLRPLAVFAQCLNESLVNFQGMHRQIIQIGQGRIACPEIIQGQQQAARPQTPQFFNVFGHFFNQNAFRDFQFQLLDADASLGNAFVHELYKAGFTITDINPDFVIVGETRSYNWDMMHKAAFFVNNGARVIATNQDTHGHGFTPACGALCAPIEKITGRKPFYVGKPSPWIIRAALNKMQGHSEETVIVGDNLRTDILAGFQAGLETVLVLSGVSNLNDVESMPFRPSHIFPSVADITIF